MLFGVGHVGRQMIAGNPVVGGATLDLGFMVPGSLDPRLTFTRASTATYFDATGTMQSAAVNAPRWDYDPATLALRGLLIEEARTNTLLNSNTLNPTSGCVASTDVPVLFAAATQWKYTVVAAGGNGPIWAINAPSAASTTFAASCWVYIPAAYSTAVDGMPRLDIDNSGLGTGGSQSAAAVADATKRNQWQRLVSTISFGTSPGTIFNVLIRNNAPTNGGSIFYCTCPQIEVGAFATSYIPTTAAAVTRAIDLPSIAPANMGFFVSPGGSWMTEFNCQYYQAGGTYQRVVLTGPPPNGPGPIMTNVGFAVQFDGTIQQTANSAPVNTVQKIASTYGASQGQLCVNAGPVNIFGLSGGYAGAVANGVALMVATGSGNQNTPGWLRRLRYWPRVLSAAEMQQVTT